MKEQRTEILVVGDGTGGVAVALGCRMVLTEETDWIGGQLTLQAVPPDEHRCIESYGCTARYWRFLQGVRELSLAAFCLQKKMTPQQVHNERGIVE